MQSLAETKLNPSNYHLSQDAKKRLRWLYLLYYDQRGNVSAAARKAGISRPWMSHLKQMFEHNNKDPRCLEPESRAPGNTEKRNRISKENENLIIKIRDDSLNSWGKEKIAWVMKRDYKVIVNHNTVNKYLHKRKRINPKISLKNSKAFEEKKYRESENILLKVKFRPPSKLKDYAPGALVEKDMKYLIKPKQEHYGKHKDNYNFKRPHQALGYLTPMEFYALWKKNPDRAYAIAEKWQEYLKKQRLRLAKARRIKKKEQIETLMKFIDAKLNHKKQEVEEAKNKLIDCKLCSVA